MDPGKTNKDIPIRFRGLLRRDDRQSKESIASLPDRAHSSLRNCFQRGYTLIVHRFPLFSATIGAVLLTVIGVGFWISIVTFIDPGTAAERTNLLATVAQIVGGLIIVLGLVFTAQTYLVNREGHITERFSRAIDHLGDKELPIRLGGIYALERIARDSPRDQQQIVEILTAFVRQSVPVSVARRQEWTALVSSDKDPGTPHSDWLEDDWQAKPDIRAILTVLGRREKGARRREPISLDLSDTDLRGLNLSTSYLSMSSLASCDLEGVWIKWADLSGSSMNGSNLRDATLAGATLRNAWVQHVFAIGTHFTEVDFRGANLYGSKFQWAGFWRAELTGVGFHHCNLDNADFMEASLVRVSFSDTSLNKTSFTKADLTNADLRGLDLSRCRGLTTEQIAQAIIDSTTKLPADIRAG